MIPIALDWGLDKLTLQSNTYLSTISDIFLWSPLTFPATTSTVLLGETDFSPSFPYRQLGREKYRFVSSDYNESVEKIFTYLPLDLL
jgi:hypothetical protein